MQVRAIREEDYREVISVIDEWWGGRQMAAMLPKLFFIHFQDTSFVVEDEGKIVAFLVGLVSQTAPDEAYIHFVGVDPNYRKQQLGNRLYQLFFERAVEKGCRKVRCITSPVNEGSISFHKRMGFAVERVAEDYDGQGQSRVLFIKQIG
ncbi:GNAT family N-acetyltransferase [Tumebacillus lipolyticus]|uniref:GNAT family N-acetyltransferase n=1 Tax=Tumebacillus lipolyticus TaxID=1280370 RepID=A0ABW4ZRT1_9BACL